MSADGGLRLLEDGGEILRCCRRPSGCWPDAPERFQEKKGKRAESEFPENTLHFQKPVHHTLVT
jgi:hypothetical protein